MKFLKEKGTLWAKHLREMVFPTACIGCGKWGLWICENCRPTFRVIGKDRCLQCGQISPSVQRNCDYCRDKDFPFCRTEAIFCYSGRVREAIHRLKYGSQAYIGKILGQWLGRWLSHYNPFREADGIAPIPLPRRRLLKRKYNQAEIVARQVAAHLKVPLLSPLSRQWSRPQTFLSQKEREKNLEGAFTFLGEKGAYKRKNILLVDDVFTTGSTLAEAGRVLRQEGRCRKVYAAVVAR